MEAERPIPSMQQHWVILECQKDPTQAAAAPSAPAATTAKPKASTAAAPKAGAPAAPKAAAPAAPKAGAAAPKAKTLTEKGKSI